jgi:hypothetical protein
MANELKIGVVDDFFDMCPVERRLKRISKLGFEGVQLWLTCVELAFDLGGSGACFSPTGRDVHFP